MKKTVIIGNWKMNKTATQTQEFLNQLSIHLKENENKILSNLDYAIAAPFTNLSVFSGNKTNLKIAAQDVSEHISGAFTGEISADMLKDLNVSYVVIGHSERRMYHKESDQLVNAKAKIALEKGIIPVICVGETLEQYEQGITKDIIKNQIQNSLADLDLSKIIVAYEPIWAIGTGKVATPQVAQEVCEFIRLITSPDLIIQYGGSVSPSNIQDLHSQKDINGFLVGGASLEASSFVKLLTLGK
ncbi:MULTISPECIES: triose-phosphate isomerase [unclassified Mycoplasma]|uniref:triose-phosphate isomerase n=1 Tax=unclassified Mycoplasma TaxID=2683645 RepID=UPI00211BB8C3|nr:MULTISPECIES: triose-phosphate isomerase [unclassified Mycoplasma]UUM19914.1 triose-phosphate isomerase [Mycoplasma sp. 1578d]UUM24894.1 triose-phosphate isomerase [Mycoplasma sp. 3686d]